MSFFKDRNCYLKNYNLSLFERVKRFNYGYLGLICLVVAVGLMTLYSAAGGSWEPWAGRQFIRFLMSLCLLGVVALFPLRFWMKYAYGFYGAAFILLICVTLFGHVGMGAQRWLNLGFIRLQPSELMKIALVLALARYFHGAGIEEVRSNRFLIPPLLMMVLPVGLIMEQPDLGTALMLVFATAGMFFIAGVQVWKFIAVTALAVVSLPIVWTCLHDYQRQRVLTFLNPENDPFGAGYHILQSKIALGSGGLLGKGFMQGTQSRLSFLPEKQTDFIFTMISEEFGLVGAFFLCFLYALIIGYGFVIAQRAASFFGKLLAIGLTINFALYVFINMSMVMGLMPVVGIPLPLISYGGTAMMTLFIGFGLIQCVDINREMVIGRRGSIDDE